MKNNQNSKSIILLVSAYDWNHYEFNEEEQRWGRFPREFLHEVPVRDIVDMAVLFQKFGSRVKYKKPTDKNWYTHRAMMNRLFKKEADERFDEIGGRLLAVSNLTEDVLEKERNRYSIGTLNPKEPRKSRYYRYMPSGDYVEVTPTGWA
ncbi:hypothetical protein [Priestia megaterium]|uniref:hypothetical protein n=1 Tax=Priestia megaterium TaxID=1404 RepID=UPI002079513D|nr:hypothetical protein [Priestia megaterium]USL25093.1 hypothetical protein LIT33_02270 [Priestia megaterium]